MVEIKTTQAGYPLEDANQILIRPIIEDTTDKICSTHWKLFNKDGKIISDGNIPITEEEYALWGDTNDSLEDIVLGKLNLERK
jgi:hypothetical protein